MNNTSERVADWRRYRIVPQDVEARQVTDPEGEVIQKRSGPRRVPFGNWIIRTSNGELWSTSQDVFQECYALIEAAR